MGTENTVAVVPRTMYEADLRHFQPLRDGLLCRRLEMPPGSTLSDVIEIPGIARKTELLGSFARTVNKSIRGVVVRKGRKALGTVEGDIVWWGQYLDLEDEAHGLVAISEKDVRFVEVLS